MQDGQLGLGYGRHGQGSPMAGHGHGHAVKLGKCAGSWADQDKEFKGVLGKPPVSVRFGVRPWRLRGAGRGSSRGRVLSPTFLEKHNTVVILNVFIIIVCKISISL